MGRLKILDQSPAASLSKIKYQIFQQRLADIGMKFFFYPSCPENRNTWKVTIQTIATIDLGPRDAL